MELCKRKSTRIPLFDYSSDQFYFVTICAYDKKCIFGKPGELNQIGKIVYDALINIPNHYQHIKIDHCVVMPNHLHAIIVVGCDGEAGERPSLNTVVGQFKSGCAREIHKIHSDLKVWQRSYHDHIIRNPESYKKIWQYIDTNPIRWNEDCFFVIM